jgi:hypothetical protein
MSWLSNNRVLVTLISLIFSISLVIPPILVATIPYSPDKLALSGTPVNETSFADLVSSIPDPVVFTQYDVQSDVSVHMRAEYKGLETVNESAAIAISMDFLERIPYLSEANLTINEGWTLLDNGVWGFQFHGVNGSVYVSVNAISGKIISFSSNNEFLPQTQEGVLSIADYEQIAQEFLLEFNYTLSEHARYVGPKVEYNRVYWRDMCTLIFYNVVNGIYIEGNGVFFALEPDTGALVEFGYRWVQIDDIPLEDTISSEYAMSKALAYVSNHTGPSGVSVTYRVTYTVMMFEHMWTPLGHEYRLGWIVYLTSNPSTITSVHIDAMSGVHYNTGGVAIDTLIYTDESQVSLPIVFFVLLGSTAIACIVYFGLRRYLLT